MMSAAALLALLVVAASAAAAPAAAAPSPPSTPKQPQQRQNFSFTLPPQRNVRPLRKVTIDARLGKGSPDGVSRDVILVAGTNDGNAANNAPPPSFQPPIVVSQGDELELRLVNSLPSSYPQAGGGISVHQHGFSMADGQAAWHDGAAEISACKVPPLKSADAGAKARQTNERVARFVVRERPGTYFWHDHTSLLRGDGLMGGLIVTPPPWAPQAPLAMLPGAGFGGDERGTLPPSAYFS